MIWQIVGLIASAMIILSFLPQIYRGFRTKKLDDLSYYFVVFLGIGQFFWLLYGLHLKDLPIIITNIAGVSCNLTLITMKYLYSKK